MAQGVITGREGTVVGDLSTPLDAEVRPMAGIHLTRISSGACRFTFTTWDDAMLSQGPRPRLWWGGGWVAEGANWGASLANFRMKPPDLLRS